MPITDTSTSNISGTQGQVWMDKVLAYGEALRRFDQSVMNINIPKGNKKWTVTKSTGHTDVDVAKSSGEGGSRDTTELTNLNTASINITASDFKQGLVKISKEIEYTSRVDLIREARRVIAEDQADDLDVAIAGSSSAAGILQSTDVTNEVFGGSASDVSSLSSGDVITTDLVANAMAKLETNNFEPNQLYISPKQYKAFRKDSQFVHAAEYGSDRVVLRGEIGDYLGVKIIKTTNTPTYTSGTSDQNDDDYAYGADGHTCPMVGTDRMGKKAAGAVGWVEKPAIDYEYKKEDGAHMVYYDQTFGTTIVQEDAVCLIKVTDS